MKAFKWVLRLEVSSISIRNKLIFTSVLILLIPLLIMGQIFYHTAKNKVSEQMIQSSNESLKLLDKLITSTLVSTMNNISTLSMNINASLYNGIESPLVRNYLDSYQKTHPEASSTFLGTESGLTIISPYQKVAGDYDPRNRPWYQAAMKNKGKAYITEPYMEMDSSTNKPTGNVIVTIVQATADGSGVVGTYLNLSKIADSGKNVRIGKEGYVTILDKNSKALVHPSLEIGTKLTDGWVKKIYAQESGEFNYLEGIEKKVTFLTNSLTGWKLIGTMNKEEISREASTINQTIYLIIALAVLFGGMLIILIVRSITSPLLMLVGATEKISQGDLTQQIDLNRRDEIGRLAGTFNQMTFSLRELIQQVSTSAEQVSASAEQLTASAQENSKATEQISMAVKEVSLGSEKQISSTTEAVQIVSEISKGMEQVTFSILSVADSSAVTKEQAAEGYQVVNQAIGQMNAVEEKVVSTSTLVNRLGEKSKEIGQIVGIITEISSQTNLLALNAAIEAARAGDNGRGFAVVADEVRKLAEQSGEAAGKIRELVEHIQQEIEKAVCSMDEGTHAVKEGMSRVYQTGGAFQRIVQRIDEISFQSQEVSAIVKEVNSGSQHMVEMMEELAQISQQSAGNMQSVTAAGEEQNASMDEIASAASELSHMSQELQKIISKFKV